MNLPLPLLMPDLSDLYEDAVDIDDKDEDEDDADGLLVNARVGFPSFPNNAGGGLCSGNDIHKDSKMAVKLRL